MDKILPFKQSGSVLLVTLILMSVLASMSGLIFILNNQQKLFINDAQDRATAEAAALIAVKSGITFMQSISNTYNNIALCTPNPLNAPTACNANQTIYSQNLSLDPLDPNNGAPAGGWDAWWNTATGNKSYLIEFECVRPARNNSPNDPNLGFSDGPKGYAVFRITGRGKSNANFQNTAYSRQYYRVTNIKFPTPNYATLQYTVSYNSMCSPYSDTRTIGLNQELNLSGQSRNNSNPMVYAACFENGYGWTCGYGRTSFGSCSVDSVGNVSACLYSAGGGFYNPGNANNYYPPPYNLNPASIEGHKGACSTVCSNNLGNVYVLNSSSAVTLTAHYPQNRSVTLTCSVISPMTGTPPRICTDPNL